MNFSELMNKTIVICGPYWASEPIRGRVVDVVGDYVYLDSEPLPIDLSEDGLYGINGYSLKIV